MKTWLSISLILLCVGLSFYIGMKVSQSQAEALLDRADQTIEMKNEIIKDLVVRTHELDSLIVDFTVSFDQYKEQQQLLLYEMKKSSDRSYRIILGRIDQLDTLHQKRINLSLKAQKFDL